MSIYCVNEMIKKTRTECLFSQEDLAFGICSVSTLSKIENGLEDPSRSIFIQLMERMGNDECLYGSYASEQEYECSMMQYEIIKDICRNNISQRDEKIGLYLMRENKRDDFFRFLLIYKNLLGENPNIDWCMKEIDSIVGGHIDNEHTLKNLFLRENEITYLLLEAQCHKKKGNCKMQRKILCSLRTYLETDFRYDDLYGDLLIVTLMELAKSYGETEQFEKALFYINIAQNEIEIQQKMFYYTKLFEIKSQIYNLQDDIEKENRFKGYVQFLSSLFEMKGLADMQPQEEMNYSCFSAYYS